MTRTADLAEPVSPNGKEVLTPGSRAGWREWLASHPDRTDGIWVVFRKRSSALEGPDYDDLVEEALCFGWIDSQARGVDEERTMLWFSPRRPGGFWSRSNKERIHRLTAANLMTERGRAAIEAARVDGSWARADDVEGLVLHADLEAALSASPEAMAAYEGLSESSKRQHLWWVYSAKRADTRAKRTAELVRRLTEGK